MQCRSCSTEIKAPFLSLGKTPLSNSYVKKEDLNKPEPQFPLETFICPKCLLVQVDDFERPENIFNEDYAYFSSYSDSWLKHCENYATEMTSRLRLSAKSLVMEIASNDGYLLQYFKAKGISVLGIEPTKNTALVAQEKGIPTETVFFNTETAKKLKESGRAADLLLGNNVLAHVPGLNDFVGGLRHALKPTGTLTMEFPHLEKMIEGLQFDTIYHEHFCYYSLYVVKNLFFKHGLTVYDVQELPTHGGSLRVFARHNENATLKVQPIVEDIISREVKKGFTTVDFFNAFPKKVERVKKDLLEFLKTAKAEGKTVAGYGAPAKGKGEQPGDHQRGAEHHRLGEHALEDVREIFGGDRERLHGSSRNALPVRCRKTASRFGSSIATEVIRTPSCAAVSNRRGRTRLLSSTRRVSRPWSAERL